MDEKPLELEDLLPRLKREADAYPFVCDGWAYSRDHDIKSIRYRNPDRAHWPIRRNIGHALEALLPWRRGNLYHALYDNLREGKGRLALLRSDIKQAWSWLQYTDDHLPDGVVDGSAIITYWEEAGQHVAAFNPAVTPELTRLALVGWRAEQAERDAIDRLEAEGGAIKTYDE